jgi:hypothetical protein
VGRDAGEPSNDSPAQYVRPARPNPSFDGTPNCLSGAFPTLSDSLEGKGRKLTRLQRLTFPPSPVPNPSLPWRLYASFQHPPRHPPGPGRGNQLLRRPHRWVRSFFLLFFSGKRTGTDVCFPPSRSRPNCRAGRFPHRDGEEASSAVDGRVAWTGRAETARVNLMTTIPQPL